MSLIVSPVYHRRVQSCLDRTVRAVTIIWQGRGVDLQPIEIVCRPLASIGDGFVTVLIEMGRYLHADPQGSGPVEYAS